MLKDSSTDDVSHASVPHARQAAGALLDPAHASLGEIGLAPSVAQKSWICALLGIPIVLWLFIFPYTGDGDSVLHYLCARSVWVDPSTILGSWSRPLHKLLIIFPAIGGIVPARLCQAFLTLALAWQTVSLAAQLRLRHAILAAPLLVFQPFVFMLASDTMTEIPAALAIVIAVRLWMSGRLAWSCVVASLLPMLRPEGFFLIALWGIMLLLPRVPGDLPNETAGASRLRWPPLGVMSRRRFLPACLLSVGMLLWVLACFILTTHHDPLYFLTIWSWPMNSYEAYRPGPIFHYIVTWPIYTGLILIGPFLAGIIPTLRRPRMRLVWIIWLLVIVLHSLLFWLHKFASVGLLRIMACTAPMTALICLEGINAIGRWLAGRGYEPALRRRLAMWTVALAFVWAMLFYAVIGEHYHTFGYRRLAREAAARELLADFRARQSSDDPKSPQLIAGDKMFLAVMGMTAEPRHYDDAAMDGPEEAKMLAAEPIGSVGAWDNEQSVAWHTVTIDELPALGYTILYEYDQTVPDVHDCFKRHSFFVQQRYVLIRKDRAKETR